MTTDITDARACFEDQYHIKRNVIDLKILKLEFRNEFGLFMRKIVQQKTFITHITREGSCGTGGFWLHKKLFLTCLKVSLDIFCVGNNF